MCNKTRSKRNSVIRQGAEHHIIFKTNEYLTLRYKNIYIGKAQKLHLKPQIP